MNRTLTLSPNAAKPNAAKPNAGARLRRTLTRRWDTLAVAGLLLSTGVYGAYALTQMTGF